VVQGGPGAVEHHPRATRLRQPRHTRVEVRGHPPRKRLGLGRYERAFRDNDIVDAELIARLTAEDLREIGVTSVGHRRKLLDAIAARRAADPPFPVALPDAQQSGPLSRIGGERRQLTVMIVDLVGSTALSARLDPEEMGEIISAYQSLVAAEINQFGGHVAKYMGDGVLAYFGWPRAQEDAAERAVRAGLAVAAVVPGIAAPDRDRLAARVGIATGRVVVGELVGSGEARERAVVGETPNLAARLQTLAEPGEVIVADGTRRLLGGLFAYRDLGPTRLKGFSNPVGAFAIVGEGTAESRFEAMHAADAGLTALVGREHEIALLLDRWERAKDGEGQVVLLAGEAGIGKSRLVRALRERLGSEPHRALSQFCSPYHRNTALHPVIGLLERAAGLRREEPLERQLDRLETMLAFATEDVREHVPPLADLLGIPTANRYPPLELGPQQRKERTFQALLDQLAGLTAREPALAIYEDVHWADPTTLELLGRVVERVQRLPVLVVVTFRPEFVPSWTGYGHVTALSLGRLGRRQGGTMVGRLAGGKALPPEVLEQILNRTDGVPLFVEELTKAVLESGLLRDEGDRYGLEGPLPPLAIPATLQDSLMARLDRLAPAKEVAQVAAVIGREFPHALLAAVAGSRDDELRDALGQLVGAELVFRRGEPPNAIYTFKHALVRDVAYQSLLNSRRQLLHARIASALEDRFPARAAAEPELLARHHAGAGSAERAISYWRKAAELAIRRSANLEAIAHCDNAETQLRTLPSSAERTQVELEVQLAKGLAVRAGMGYSAPEAERVFLRACELCEELGDGVRLVHALRGLWGFYYVAARWPDAIRVADRLDVVAKCLSDRVGLSVREYVTGTTLLFRGEPRGAPRRLRAALRLYDEGDRDAHIRHSGHDTATSVRAQLTLVQWFLGLPQQALRTSDEGLEMARRVAHPFSLAQMLAYSAIVRVLAREWDAAEAMAAEAREVSTRYGLVTYQALGTMSAGMATAGRGDATKGVWLIQEGMAALRRTGGGCFIPLALGHLALALGASGDAEAALASAAEAVRVARASGELCWEAETLRILGEVKGAAGAAPDDIQALYRAALEVARQQEAKALELRAAISLARLWAEHGECGQSRDLLGRVYSRFTEGYGTSDLREAKALLEELASTPLGSRTRPRRRPTVPVNNPG
jgi:class 3 adenylate cyclase/tetratricopeptide (TPR) repeat protein